MIKIYSEADLLYYDRVHKFGSTFFKGMDKLLGVALSIEIPSSHLTRLTTICRDFRNRTNAVLFIDKLIQLLVEDFVDEITETSNLKEIYRRIISMDHSVEISGLEENRVSNIHNLPDSYFSNLQTKRVIFKYDDIYSLETILSDMEEIHEHKYTAEKLIGFLVSAFVIDIQKSGFGKIINEISYRLNSEGE